MRSTLGTILHSLLLLAIPVGAVSAQQSALGEEAAAALAGDWSGTIVAQSMSQDVLWRFERASSGELRGFMGPATMGTATIPMQEIASDGTELSFDVDSQRGRFVGTLSEGEAAGIWRQGQSGQVSLTRSDLDSAGDAARTGGIYAPVLGRWEGRQGANPDGPPIVYLRFELGDSGELIGFAGDSPEAVSVPLEDVELDGGELSFRPPADGPGTRRFTGEVSGNTVTGTWFEGVEASLTMRKASGE